MSEPASKVILKAESKDTNDKKEEKQFQDFGKDPLIFTQKIPKAYLKLLKDCLENLTKYGDGTEAFKVPSSELCPFEPSYLQLIIQEVNRRKNITAITFYEAGIKITDEAASYLIRNLSERVTMFHFEGHIGNKSLQALSQRKTLRVLYLNGCEFDDEGIKELIRCENLENLDISDCEKLTPKCGLFLAEIKKLRRLSMYNGFSHVDSREEAQWNENFIRNLSSSSSLVELEFQQTQCSDKLIEYLINMQNLRVINLTHAVMNDTVKKKLRETTRLSATLEIGEQVKSSSPQSQ